jgi:hypothetical protein
MNTTTTDGQVRSAQRLVSDLSDRMRPLAALADHAVNGAADGDALALACGIREFWKDLSAVQVALGDLPAEG